MISLEKLRKKLNLPEIDNGLLTSPLTNQFVPKTPKIGIDRTLTKKTIKPEEKVIPREKYKLSLPIYTTWQSDEEKKSADNIQLYKTKKLKMVYSCIEEEQQNLNKEIIDYQELTRIMNNDESIFQSFVDPKLGTWINPPKERTVEQLTFDSNFEEGNLRMAVEIKDNEYDLVMRKDINSKNAYSWFFFEVISPVQKEIKFNIINFPRKRLLYNDTTRVLVYNENDKWTRNTYNVYTFFNIIPIPLNIIDETNNSNKNEGEPGSEEKDNSNDEANVNKGPTNYYTTLTFTYNFRKDLINKPVYFAYCFPYTYTNLQNYLYELSLDPANKSLIKFSTLDKSACGNPLDILYITNWNDSTFDSKKIIFLTGRVHPGESNSSYVVEGVINALLSPEANELRKNFIFKIVPMLNADGIINGNYRNNIWGKDLNRLWPDARKNMCPTIFATKSLMKLVKPEFYCDFHGHSTISNICMYGCTQTSKTSLYVLNNKSYKADEEKVFMKIYEKNKFYNKESSRYTITKFKKRTGRAVVCNEIGVNKSYCLETSTMSFVDDCGEMPINLNLLRDIGKDFVDCLGKLFNKTIFLQIWCKIRADAEEKKKKKKKKGKKKDEESGGDERLKKFFRFETEEINVRKRAESEGKNNWMFNKYLKEKEDK